MERVGVSRDARGSSVKKKSQLIGHNTIRTQTTIYYREISSHNNEQNDARTFYSKENQMCSFVLKRTTRKNMKMKRGTNLDRRASFERALPRFVLSPLPLFPVFPLRLRDTVLLGWINAREIPVFCTAKIRVFGSFTVLFCTRISISFLLLYTATHGKWQPYCTRSNACQPAHSHYRGNVRKKLRLRCSSVSNVHTLRHDKRFVLRYREKCTSKWLIRKETLEIRLPMQRTCLRRDSAYDLP